MTALWLSKKQLNWLDKHARLIVVGFFALYLVLGLAVVKDYGISWDEPTERFTSLWHYKFAVSKMFDLAGYQSPLIGELMYNHQMLHTHIDRYYGTFVHWPLVAIEHATGFKQDSQSVYFLRHINTFLYFYVSMIAFYWLLTVRFKSWKVGLLGVFFMVLSPRIFAESFYNNKDILFMSWYLLSIVAGQWFLAQKSWWRAVVFGVVLGITINTRIMGVLILGLVGLWSLVDLLCERRQLGSKKVVLAVASLVLLVFVTYATYIVSIPTAWGNEVRFLPEVFAQFSQYSWQGKTLYLNGFANWDSIPWHYIPVYLWATTPLWYGFLFGVGVVSLGVKIAQLRHHLQRWWANPVWRSDVFMLVAGLVPLLAIIVLHSVVYNSWRHMYFIYGPFVYLMLLGIANWTRARRWLLLGTAISFLFTGVWMIKNHPYQFMYFNPLVRPYATDSFERDYWGLATLDMLEYILATDPRPIIHIWRHDFTYKAIDLMLDRKEKNRFRIVEDRLDADYSTHMFYNTRDKNWVEPGFEEIKNIEVDGIRMQSLFKRLPVATEAATATPSAN